jgi:hypothetical protein
MEGFRMTYTQFPMEQVKIDNLRLDLDNYRIPTRPDDEAGALDYLFTSEQVLEAAKLILRTGYFDNEVPIVVEDHGAYIVLEGNRRVSALKALQNPGLVPHHEQEVRELLKRYAVEAENLPAAIRVLVTPNRKAAASHIAHLHTTPSKKRWSRDQQAKYYYSQIGPNSTVEELRAAYPGVDVPRFVKIAVMRLFLTGVHYRDTSLRDYAESVLTVSAFEYAYRNATIAASIGVDFDAGGQLLPRKMGPTKIGAALSAPQRDAVEYLVNEFRAGRLNTRSPQFKKASPEHKALLAQLAGQAEVQQPIGGPSSTSSPSTSIAGGSRDSEGTPAAAARPTSAQPGIARGPNHPDTKDSLQTSGLDYGKAPVNLQRRFQELRKLSLSATPAATAMLLRSLLETTIKTHFETGGKSVNGELKECFKSVKSVYGSQKALKYPINLIESGGTDKPGSIQWFNVLAHSVDIQVGADDVRTAYSNLEPVLRRLLQPADGPSQ